jgi:hypothetical protein
LSTLAKFESLVARLVEGTFGRWFSGTLQPVEVGGALARALEDYQFVDEQGRHFAPNVFWVYVHPGDYEALRAAQPSLPNDLAQSVAELARLADLTLTDPPVVEIVSADQIPRGRVSVAAQYVAQETEPLGPTQEISRAEIRKVIESASRRSSFLILDGKRHVALTKPIVALGRALDNDLVIDDGRVSRHHAQLRRRSDHYVIYDTGSSGGTTVNGQPITEHTLQAGDVIGLAGYAIVFGEDTPASAEPPIGFEDTPALDGQ